MHEQGVSSLILRERELISHQPAPSLASITVKLDNRPRSTPLSPQHYGVVLKYSHGYILVHALVYMSGILIQDVVSLSLIHI